MTRPDVLDALLDLIAERVAERVLERIGHASTVTYTTAKGGPHIPGKSRDWMRRHVKTIPGSRKIGRDWTLAKADYDAWATAQDIARQRTAPPVKPVLDDIDWADACIAEAGFRVAKRSA